ncbi:MAG: TIGR00159 family protein [bacterium]|nr:TIGR00159 family protein [bacterium]
MFGIDFRIRDIIDILIIAFVAYRIIVLIKGTRGLPMVFGVLILVAVSVVARLLDFHTFNWFADKVKEVWLLALLIVFQPEIRSALSRLGRNRIVRRILGVREAVVDEVVRTVDRFSKDRIGALIVFERDVPLGEYTDKGVKMQSALSAELLRAIFAKNSPLHDGAVIVENETILSAAVMLPLTENPNVARTLGARHRAAIGISDVSDAIVIVVSEETGRFSLVKGGEIHTYSDLALFKSYLVSYLQGVV